MDKVKGNNVRIVGKSLFAIYRVFREVREIWKIQSNEVETKYFYLNVDELFHMLFNGNKHPPL